MTVACSNRRLFLKNLLKGSAGVALTGISGNLSASSYLLKHRQELVGDRVLKFYNRHTGERFQTSYWVEGQYQNQAIEALDHLLRDHRQNETHTIDRNLYDLLFQLQTRLEVDKEIHVISAYRSPKTNQLLAANSNGVAKKSYHMKGMAIDIAIPGIDIKQLHKAAVSMRAGGVGFYPRSGFIHLDTGRVRFW